MCGSLLACILFATGADPVVAGWSLIVEIHFTASGRGGGAGAAAAAAAVGGGSTAVGAVLISTPVLHLPHKLTTTLKQAQKH
jgi:hypothetical protein